MVNSIKKREQGTGGVIWKIILALAAAALSALMPSCVSIGNPRVYELRYDTGGMKYEKSADGWTAQDAKYKISFRSEPAEPEAGQPVEFRIEIFDKIKNKALPPDETAIECTSLMPDTPGYMRVLSLKKQNPKTSPGICSILPLNFDTPGKWIVIYSISLNNGENLRVDFPVTVSGAAK